MLLLTIDANLPWYSPLDGTKHEKGLWCLRGPSSPPKMAAQRRTTFQSLSPITPVWQKPHSSLRPGDNSCPVIQNSKNLPFLIQSLSFSYLESLLFALVVLLRSLGIPSHCSLSLPSQDLHTRILIEIPVTAISDLKAFKVRRRQCLHFFSHIVLERQ